VTDRVAASAPSPGAAPEETDAPEPVRDPPHPPASAQDELRAPEPVERLLEQVAAPSEMLGGGGGLRVARIVSVAGAAALIEWRGSAARVGAVLAPGLEVELLEQAVEDRGMVLVEEGSAPLVVGVLQTRRPRELKLRAGTVTIEGEHEVMIRAGHAAIRLRGDGDIEIVGSRISAASRGLLRLVGRILRLN
jgi:hypothetical protein